MTKLIDLTGKRFGKLLVIQRDKNYISPGGQSFTKWLCQCDCGNITSVRSLSLRNKDCESCGCLRVEKTKERNAKNLKGKRFGKLIAQYKTEKRVDRCVIWHCICDCGNTVDIISKNLLSGNSLSCGCSHHHTPPNFINLEGKRFGKLVVQYQNGRTKSQRVIWYCLCDCGQKINVISSDLLSKHTKSCGCQKESFLSTEIKKHFIKKYNAKTEYKILKNPKTKFWLPYDVYISGGDIPNINGIYIEINGEQHYKINDWHVRQSKNNESNPETEFVYQQYKDQLKKEFAEKNGIYIEVNLVKLKTIESIISYIDEILKAVNIMLLI